MFSKRHKRRKIKAAISKIKEDITNFDHQRQLSEDNRDIYYSTLTNNYYNNKEELKSHYPSQHSNNCSQSEESNDGQARGEESNYNQPEEDELGDHITGQEEYDDGHCERENSILNCDINFGLPTEQNSGNEFTLYSVCQCYIIIRLKTMYSIVEFLYPDGKNEVEVVPVLWLRDSNICFWPHYKSGKKIKQLVKSQANVDESSWKKYSCRTLHTFDTIEKAMKKLPSAQFHSELSESELDLPKRKKSKISSTRRYAEDSDEEFCNPKQNIGSKYFLPLPPHKTTIIKEANSALQLQTNALEVIEDEPIFTLEQVQQSAFENDSHISDMSQYQMFCTNQSISTANASILSKSVTATTSNNQQQGVEKTLSDKSLTGFENKVLSNFEILKLEIQCLHSKLDYIVEAVQGLSLRKNENVPENKELESILISMLPLNTCEEMDNFNTTVQENPESISLMANYLAKAGGKTLNKATHRMMIKVVTDELADKYSLKGIRGKKAFLHLKIVEILFDALKINPATNAIVNENDLESSISSWLKHAHGRIAKRLPT